MCYNLAFSCEVPTLVYVMFHRPSDNYVTVVLCFVGLQLWLWRLCALCRFGLWSGDHVDGTSVHREGQWWECEAGLPVHFGRGRFWATWYWMELTSVWQPKRWHSGRWRFLLSSMKVCLTMFFTEMFLFCFLNYQLCNSITVCKRIMLLCCAGRTSLE